MAAPTNFSTQVPEPRSGHRTALLVSGWLLILMSPAWWFALLFIEVMWGQADTGNGYNGVEVFFVALLAAIPTIFGVVAVRRAQH